MKKIKFRGKHIPTGEWVYGYYVESSGVASIVTDEPEQKQRYVDKNTVGQYTGLKDKHGVEIYEGDIVKHTRVRSYNVFHNPKQTFLVEWQDKRFDDGEINELGFKFKKLFNYMSTIFDESDIEVIGNIYENPELLEEQK